MQNEQSVPPLINPRVPRWEGRPIRNAAGRLDFVPDIDPINHRIFRFPARFHPPVVRELIRRYARPAQIILDPFSGSGTVPVEALLAGCSAVATDVDPLSVLITRAKTCNYDLSILSEVFVWLETELVSMRKADEDLWGCFKDDISDNAFSGAARALVKYIPLLPNVRHWFRKRVIIQLAALRARVDSLAMSPTQPLLRLCFASIIRNASNADPVPVSGLEVTKYMLEKEAAGRVIDPYTLLTSSIRKALQATKRFQEQRTGRGSARVSRADARHLSIRGTGAVDCILTSPPYLTAVDYYRRHTLEMYWLGLTETREDRISLLPGYLGRDKVGSRQMEGLDKARGTAVAVEWLSTMSALPPERQRAFKHYCAGMGESLSRLHDVARVGAPIIIVVGDVQLAGSKVSMVELLSDLAPRGLRLTERLWYPLENRFMSYERQNDADIDVDHVLVFEARG